MCRRRSARRIAFALAGLVALAAARLVATVVVPAEFRDIVSGAELIVRGRVMDVRGIAVRGEGIDSIATVVIDATLKGQAADAFVSVRVPGGDLGRYRFVMVGAPRLRVNDSAIFFLQRDADGSWRPVGLSSGVFTIGLDPATGRPAVHPPVIAGRTASTGRVVRGDARRPLLPVPDFEAMVRVVLVGDTVRTARSRE